MKVCKYCNVVQTSDTSASLMCAPPDTDPVVGGGPALRDTVNSLVIRTFVENKQEQESRVRTETEYKLFCKAAD